MCAGIEISNQLFIKKLKKKRQQQQQKHHIFNLMHAISILLPRRTRYFHESRYIYVRDSFSFVAICYCGCFDENFLGYYANGNVIFKKLYDFKCDSKSLARQSRKNIQNIPGTFTVFGSKFLKILHIQRAPCYMHKQHRHRNIIRFVAACKHLLENWRFMFRCKKSIAFPMQLYVSFAQFERKAWKLTFQQEYKY